MKVFLNLFLIKEHTSRRIKITYDVTICSFIARVIVQISDIKLLMKHLKQDFFLLIVVSFYQTACCPKLSIHRWLLQLVKRMSSWTTKIFCGKFVEKELSQGNTWPLIPIILKLRKTTNKNWKMNNPNDRKRSKSAKYNEVSIRIKLYIS